MPAVDGFPAGSCAHDKGREWDRIHAGPLANGPFGPKKATEEEVVTDEAPAEANAIRAG